MRYVWNILLKGLAAVLPVGLTLYLVYWLSVSIETMLRSVITTMVPEEYYWPGMGFAAGLVLLFTIGIVVNAWLVRHLFRFGEELLEKIPLIKSVYGALRDFMDYFSSARQRKDLKNVVKVSFGDAHLIGFLTQEHLTNMPGLSQSDEMVAVYLPMSYQIGGYTIYLPRSRVEAIDMSFEDAMRMVMTAGLSKSERNK